MIIIYLLIGLLASIIGAIAGIGGGVIIKPVLDMMVHYDVGTISILSASTVFSMAVVSLIIIIFSKETEINFRTSGLLAVSSILGGFTGKIIFINLMTLIENKTIISFTQSIILTILMLVILIFHLYKDKLTSFQLNHAFFILLIGFKLVLIAAFLGIGGGPLYIAILTLGFSMTAKAASANSIFIIFFSQISSLLTTTFTTGFGDFDLSMLWYIVAGGAIGGIIGSTILTRVSNKYVVHVFTAAVTAIVLVNIFNVIKVIPDL